MKREWLESEHVGLDFGNSGDDNAAESADPSHHLQNGQCVNEIDRYCASRELNSWLRIRYIKSRSNEPLITGQFKLLWILIRPRSELSVFRNHSFPCSSSLFSSPLSLSLYFDTNWDVNFPRLKGVFDFRSIFFSNKWFRCPCQKMNTDYRQPGIDTNTF